jgi:hypothetical protein
MVIRFLCPNGHKIHCPDTQAGRAAKCPQCGIKFRIPAPSEAESAVAALPESAVGRESPVHADSGSTSGDLKLGSVTGIEHKEPQIEFLCPNGHRLHGPMSLQGRPGQCPECGSKFRVPEYDEASDQEAVEEGENGQGPINGLSEADIGLAEDGMTAEPREADSGYSLGAGDLSESGSMPATRRSLVHPWAGVFPKLWVHKSLSGAVIEIVTSDGQTIVPDRFAVAISQLSHAVFAIKDSGSTFSLTAVPWESVVQVHVRGLKKLPEDLFG